MHGFGTFTGRDLHAGEFIVELDGQIATTGEMAQILKATRAGMHEKLLNYFFLEWNFIPDFDNYNRVLLRPFRTVYSYINHSRQPNCKIIGHYPRKMWVETITDVPAGKELFLDYREESIPRWYSSSVSYL